MSMTQEIHDYHCKQIRDALKRGDRNVISCLNFLKNSSNPVTARDWSWIGSQLVMSGHLTVNEKNLFEVKHET